MSKEALNWLHGEAVLQLQLLSAAHFKPPQAKATSGIPGVRQVQDPCERSTSYAAEGKLPGGRGAGGRPGAAAGGSARTSPGGTPTPARHRPRQRPGPSGVGPGSAAPASLAARIVPGVAGGVRA